MPRTICNTSPMQYLHQCGQLDLLAKLYVEVTVPPAVVAELGEGRRRGYDLPDPAALPWVKVEAPRSSPALPLASHLGPGEAEVLALGLENPGSRLILDDGLARRSAEALGLGVTGTLGVVLKAKEGGLVQAVRPIIDLLESLKFRVSPSTREAVLKLAGE
jgi:predicted nucleic acid-binding protein